VSHSAVSIDDMRGQLHDLDWLREQLGKTEPLDSATFSTENSPQITFGTGSDGKSWFNREMTDPAPVWLEIPGGEKYQLTRQATAELASECRYPRQLQVAMPPWLLQQNMNWWLSDGLGERDLKLFCAGTGQDDHGGEVPLAVAQTRATVTPFSNLRLLEIMLGKIRDQYGDGEVLVDYKFHHDLEHTVFRLIVPGAHRVIQHTGVEDDTWSTGLQFKNFLTGLKQTEITAYVFRWWCTNGATDVANSSGGFARRGAGGDDVYEWAEEWSREVLKNVDTTLDDIQELTQVPVEGEVVPVLTDMFRDFSVPARERRRVINMMADTSDMTMYSVQAAVTRAANLEGLPYRAVEQLLTMGGHISHVSGGRCTAQHACGRLFPPGWDDAMGAVPEAPAEASQN
jgi:hypothetical protein